MSHPYREAAVAAMGEVYTGLLRNSASLPPSACERLVTLQGDEPVSRHDRPIAHVQSSPVLTGVDCRLPGHGARIVGTVSGRVSITGGHVLQGAAQTEIVPVTFRGRLPWSHYLARPGMVEALGRFSVDQLAGHFAGAVSRSAGLDLAAVSARLVNDVQSSPHLDRRVPFKAQRLGLRWLALSAPDTGEPHLRYTIHGDNSRTLVVRSGLDVAEIAGFAADLALHDWMLTALIKMVERSRIGYEGPVTVTARLRPAVTHLLHLWMPAARGSDAVAAMWEKLERRPGLSRQWQSVVDRVRDQLALTFAAQLDDIEEPVV